jgi:hypothetical protein
MAADRIVGLQLMSRTIIARIPDLSPDLLRRIERLERLEQLERPRSLLA